MIRTRPKEKGILLPDALMAAAVLTTAAIAVAAATSGRASLKARAASDREAVACYESALILAAADSSTTGGRCDPGDWRVETFGDERRWTQEGRRHVFAWPVVAP